MNWPSTWESRLKPLILLSIVWLIGGRILSPSILTSPPWRFNVMDAHFWSTQAMMERLSLTRKPTFRKNYLNPALKAGLVVMKYPDSPRSPKQQYRKVQP